MATKKTAGASATQKIASRAQFAASRTRRNDDPDVRGVRGVAEDAERTGDDGLISTADMEQIIRDEFEQVSLPSPPPMSGYHLCWLTTTSQYDSISKRSRLGYSPVRQEEVPGFDPSNGQSLGGYSGFVTCNEMVLHKIPLVRYKVIMNYFHHKKPLEDEAGIVTKVTKEGAAGEKDSKGRPLVKPEDGFEDLERTVQRTPEAGQFS